MRTFGAVTGQDCSLSKTFSSHQFQNQLMTNLDTTVLVDADMLLFQTMSALEREVQIGPEEWTRSANLGIVRDVYDQRIWKIVVRFNCSNPSQVYQCFTSGSFFRKDIHPEYKANRTKYKKPIGYLRMKNELLTRDNCFQHDAIEADDLISKEADRIQKSPACKDERLIIFSADKDLWQIPGFHCWFTDAFESPSKAKAKEWLIKWGMHYQSNGCDSRGNDIHFPTVEKDTWLKSYTVWNKNTPDFKFEDPESEISNSIPPVYYIDENAAQRFWLTQILTGDPTDNIPGLRGVGFVTAARFVDGLDITNPVECWKEIVRFYESKGKMDRPEEAALLTARLTRLLRFSEYDYVTHNVRLWTPPSKSESLLST